MAKKEMTAVPEIIDSVEALEAKMAAMRDAQKVFATYTQWRARTACTVPIPWRRSCPW